MWSTVTSLQGCEVKFMSAWFTMMSVAEHGAIMQQIAQHLFTEWINEWLNGIEK